MWMYRNVGAGKDDLQNIKIPHQFHPNQNKFKGALAVKILF